MDIQELRRRRSSTMQIDWGAVASQRLESEKQRRRQQQKQEQVIQRAIDMDNSSIGSLYGHDRTAIPPANNTRTIHTILESPQPAKSSLARLPPSAHPPGYNKKKRDIVKLILVVVAAALLRGDPVVATVLSIVSIICLKEGTFWSAKNLKWLALCIMSCAMSSASWSLERDSFDNKEERVWFGPESVLWTSAKVLELCWGVVLSVFLFSAYQHGHNSLLEFDFLYDAPVPAGPRRPPPPKTYLIY